MDVIPIVGGFSVGLAVWLSTWVIRKIWDAFVTVSSG